jgi:hypothetical protein
VNGVSLLFIISGSDTIIEGDRGKSMKRAFITALMAVSVGSAAYAGPKYGPGATRLINTQEYVRKAKAPDFWAMMPYYLPQMNPRSCSLASVSMVANAARAHQDLTAADELVTQQGLLDKTKSELWKKAVGEGGEGVSLDQLGVLAKEAFKAYGMTDVTVSVVHVDCVTTATAAALKKVLRENEKSSDDFIIANFLQSEFTGDPEGAVGHFAPIAAYDEKHGKALVFDPDRQWYEPYWVSTETLLKGMATTDKTASKNRGYIYISLNKR